jgi:hypothetical protein
MPKRMTVLASAALAVLVCALVLSVNSSSGQAAADNCLAKPNAAPPQGSHWYYRVDKVGNRRCWYLGPKDAKPRQAWSPKPQPALNPQPKTASQLMATAAAATPAQLVARAADASATLSALPASADAVDSEPASAIDGAGEYAAMHPEDDMPLTLPVLTATDLDAAEGLPGWSPKSEPRFVYVAAALALLMIVRKVFRLFAVRRLRRRRLALREQWNEERATRSRGPLSQAFVGAVAATRQAHSRHKSVTVPRTAEIPLPPADDRDSDHGIQALEVKESLQQLLYGRQRVAA